MSEKARINAGFSPSVHVPHRLSVWLWVVQSLRAAPLSRPRQRCDLIWPSLPWRGSSRRVAAPFLGRGGVHRIACSDPGCLSLVASCMSGGGLSLSTTVFRRQLRLSAFAVRPREGRPDQPDHGKAARPAGPRTTMDRPPSSFSFCVKCTPSFE